MSESTSLKVRLVSTTGNGGDGFNASVEIEDAQQMLSEYLSSKGINVDSSKITFRGAEVDLTRTVGEALAGATENDMLVATPTNVKGN